MVTTKLAQRFLIICLFAFWLGGLTFYAVVVVPTGARILGSDTDQGFITQQVTHWLNLIGVLGMIIFGWNLKTLWRKDGDIPRKQLAASWLLILLSQAALIFVHPVMDKLLDATVHSVSDPVQFYRWHRVYLIAVTVLWVGGLTHLWYLLRGWRANDIYV